MISGVNVVAQTILGTLLTWGLTALGAAAVFIVPPGNRKILDGSLGFAAGVMTAASYWSLLSPALDSAISVLGYSEHTCYIPVGIGFLLGAIFVYGVDVFIPNASNIQDALFETSSVEGVPEEADSTVLYGFPTNQLSEPRKRNVFTNSTRNYDRCTEVPHQRKTMSPKRITLLILAITMHNIPEGLAVGVGFGAIGSSSSATLDNARSLALGIGLQNFPEGLAVSLPLVASGVSRWKAFWWGQLSGMVEPLSGLLGVLLVTSMQSLLPYALAFAAGAMIFVVVDDLIPESHSCDNGKLSSCGVIIGFLVMMALDVGLG